MSNSRVSTPYPDIKQVNDERWVAPLPDDQKPVDPNTPLCLGCGRYHGSVNAELRCLRAHLQRAREAAILPTQIREAGEAMLRVRTEIDEVRSMPCSKDGSVQQLRTGKRPASSFAQG